MADSQAARFGRLFHAGDVLFREGERGAEMFVIQSGLVRISKRVGSEERPIATLGRGEFLGEMAILNNKPRSATATVLEDATCLVLDGHTLEAMISNNTEIAVRLIKKLASRLDAADALVQILMHPDPKARVLLGLKRHAESFGQPEQQGVRIRVTPDALAKEVGSSEKDVGEVLRRLERLKIAHTDDEGIVISDLGRLHEFMELIDMPRKFEAG
jgi:CRP-like cAMP-binding protein